jgi:hypothetical protein
MFSISANSTRKISIGFGLSNYENTIQPKTFTAKGSVDLVLPLGYSPQSQTCEIIANFDKNSCVISPITPPVVTPVTSNLGCINYNSSMLESWTQVKSKTAVTIAYKTGTSADKTFAKAVVNALPNTGCTLPTTISQDGYTINISWTVDPAGGQSYVCTSGTSGQFSGTYTVVTTNPILGNANFYILFLRRNNNNPDAENYIDLCQTGGVSSVG